MLTHVRVPIRLCLFAVPLLIMLREPAWSAQKTVSLYNKNHLGVMTSDDHRHCMILIETENREHVMHFYISGEEGAERLEIIEKFLPNPNYLYRETRVKLEFGPRLFRELELKPINPFALGRIHYVAAPLTPNDRDEILAAFGSQKGTMSVSFENGDTWPFILPSDKSVADIVTKCWRDALAR